MSGCSAFTHGVRFKIPLTLRQPLRANGILNRLMADFRFTCSSIDNVLAVADVRRSRWLSGAEANGNGGRPSRDGLARYLWRRSWLKQHPEIQHDQILGEIILALVRGSIRESVLQIGPDALPERVHGRQATGNAAGFQIASH